VQVNCPACSGAFEERAIGGHALMACGGCRGLWIARGAVAALRELDASQHQWLQVPGAYEAPSAAAAGVRKCPRCRATMHAYAFGGGNTRVEACDPCEHVFLDRGELAQIAREARDGIEMSEEARQQLHVARVTATSARISSAELGLSLVGVIGAYVFARIVLELGPSALVVTAAAALAVGIALWLRRSWTRDKAEASARMRRLMDAEYHRLDTSARQEASPPAKMNRAAGTRPCPFCGHGLPPGTTHCDKCDSDFG